MRDKVRTLAFYLPQFHPIPENDLWWGRGFTEWANVAEAKPVFPDHYQPHLPADLGFYDLRIPQIQEQQAALAQQYGIHGFCYYYYNFNGKKLLDLPINEMLKSGKPDFPFCLCWANENWTRKWDGRDEEVLIKQEHTLESDESFIYDILPFLKDERYIRVNNKLLLLIYRVEKIKSPQNTANKWREIVRKELGEELYLCTVNNFIKEIDPENFGFDACIQFPLDFNPSCKYNSSEIEKKNHLKTGVLKDYWFYNYDCIVKEILSVKKPNYTFFRGAFPSWDNTPRRHQSGAVFLNSTPGKYQNFLKKAIDLSIEEQKGEEQLVFINAWNEWAEGAHLEPDIKYGHAWLEATKNAIEGIEYQEPNLPKINQNTPQEYTVNYIASSQTIDHEYPNLSQQNKYTSKKPKILIVSYNYPRSDNSSGELRFSSILELLSQYWDIDFGIINSHIGANKQLKMKAYANQLQNIGINLLPLKQQAIEEAISNKHYSGAFFNFYWVAESILSHFIKYQPHAFTVVDSVDVHYARELSQAALKQLEISQALQTKARELSIYRTADITIAVSKEDFNLLKNEEKIKNTLMLPNIVPQFVRKEGIRKQIVNFIGNYAWPPNPDAVIWFATEIWPIIFSQCPEAEFQIIGSEATPEVLELSSIAGVTVLGYVPQTKPYLEMAAVSVAPLRFGGGMKGKVNEALSHGLAVVATSFGAQGFNAIHGEEMFIADDASEFADAVIFLLNDSALQEKVGLAGQALNASISSPKAIHQKIEQLVKKCKQISHTKERNFQLENFKLKLYKRTKILHDIRPGVQLLLNGGYKNFLHRGYWYLRGRKKLEDIPVKIPKHTFTVKKINHVVEFPQIDDPIVSIIIPVYNQWEYTIQCLDSIQKTSINMKYEVILMDDQSSDETIHAEKYIKNARIIRNEKNLGFLLNCNKGATLAKGRYLVFLNNDTLVQDQWLFWLVYTMDFKADVGLVGAKLIFSTGRLQEAGGIVFRDGSAMNYGREDQPDSPAYNYFKDVDYCTGASICIRKHIWDELGGFDTQFSPAYYEDTDLAFRIRKHGFRTVFQPNAIAIHFEGISHGTNLSSGTKKKQVENHKLFFKKWEKELAQNNFYRDENLFLARDRSKNKQLVLVISRQIPSYIDKRTSNILFSLASNNLYRVKLIGGLFNVKPLDISRWEQMGVEVVGESWYKGNGKQWLTENTSNISKIYFTDAKVAKNWMKEIQSIWGNNLPNIEVGAKSYTETNN